MLQFGFETSRLSSLNPVQVLQNGLASFSRLNHVKMMRALHFHLLYLLRVAFDTVQHMQSAFIVHFAKGGRPSDQEQNWTFQIFDYFRFELNELYEMVLIGQLERWEKVVK